MARYGKALEVYEIFKVQLHVVRDERFGLDFHKTLSPLIINVEKRGKS